MPHVVPVCGHWGKCQADGVAWLMEGGHARFVLTSPSSLNKEVIFYHWSLVLSKLSLNIRQGHRFIVEGNKVFVSYILDAILSDDNGHGHLFAHIHKHKQKQRSEKVLCVCQGLTLFEQHDPLRGNLIQPVGESLRSFFPTIQQRHMGQALLPPPRWLPFLPPSPTGREPSYQSPHYPNPLPAEDS